MTGRPGRAGAREPGVTIGRMHRSVSRAVNRTAEVPTATSAAASRKQVRVFQFLREVRAELKRVHWPSRTEVTSYTLVVLLAVTLLTLFVFGLDQFFGQLVVWLF